MLQERTDAIEGGLKRADEAKAEATGCSSSTRPSWPRPGMRRHGMREQAKEQGAQIKAELREEGEAERQRLVDSAGPRSRPTGSRR